MAKLNDPLTDKHHANLNKWLKQLDAIQEQINKAKKANVPGMDEVEQRCADCRADIVNLKAIYFPNKA